jgi:hypothetical protein
MRPVTLRNRDFIVDVLRDVLPTKRVILESASGSGEHVVHFARSFPRLVFQPSDREPDALQSVAAWVKATRVTNVRAPMVLDASRLPWPIASADGIICINMVHISPWDATLGLIRGASHRRHRSISMVHCGRHALLTPLHGPHKGGPLRCFVCAGSWLAENGRKRKTGRVVIRAIKAFLDAGGSQKDVLKLNHTAQFGDDTLGCGIEAFLDPLGYMAETGLSSWRRAGSRSRREISDIVSPPGAIQGVRTVVGCHPGRVRHTSCRRQSAPAARPWWGCTPAGDAARGLGAGARVGRRRWRTGAVGCIADRHQVRRRVTGMRSDRGAIPAKL